MLQRFKTSRRATVATLLVMFLVMLLFNALTQMIADDYMYSFSFVTDERLDSIPSVIESLIQHGKEGNGRYFAHFFACVFLMAPAIVFDTVNSAVFVAVVYMIYRLSSKRDKTNNYLLVGIFGLIFIFQLDFGQVCLWLDGSCNYSFGVFFGLIFIYPFILSLRDKKAMSPLLLIPHMAVSVILGGYLEPLSVGFIFSACLFLAADLFYFKNRRAFIFVPSVISSFGGLALMALAPGEITNKLSGFQLIETLAVIGVSILVLLAISPIIVAYVFFFRRAVSEGVDRRIILTSLIIAAGALASNTIMLIATYYPLRCSVAVVFMSILATGILYGSLKNRDFGKAGKIACRALTLLLCLVLITGALDNAFTYSAIKEHEEIIEQAKQMGESEVTLYNPIAITRYNAARFLIYLDINGDWPNSFFADYYGLDRVYAKSYLREIFSDEIKFFENLLNSFLPDK